MTSREIRRQFLEFFASKQHAIVPSSPVVPLDDPTLMFTNAGMNQFKDVFLGLGSRPYRRAADTQKCIRAGGKHNDLDDVGQDTYHHTFFEMLGNWSFGDYFKKEAIAWAWELLTKVWGIDKTRLHATYFQGDPAEGLEPDSEAAELWRSVTDIDPTHIHPGRKKDNFWEMGETGPCGPCSEIHYDMTPDKSGANLVNAGDARVIEVWNLVFIQYNRGSDGKLTPLPAKHVDTGMGFERVCAVLLGKQSNYDTDVFTPLFAAIQRRTSAASYGGTLPAPNRPDAGRDQEAADAQVLLDVSYRVIADHVRCLTFALTDGAYPSNEGRGYVLRRILRRAVRYGRQYFNVHEPFLCDLIEPLVEQMADVFPELRTAHGGHNVQQVIDVVRDEEESFGKTLDRGIKLFNDAADYAVKHHHGKISGDDAFRLHDTYGFPIDLTELMAEERGLTVDIGEYERLMDEARERARVGGDALDPRLREQEEKAVEKALGEARKRGLKTTDDSFKYNDPPVCTAEVVSVVQVGGNVVMNTTCTCFYSESGGQVSDTGTVTTDAGEMRVTRAEKRRDFVVHFGSMTRGDIRAGSKCRIEVSAERARTMKNHTSTHMLNWALREVLGSHIQQKGSLVDPEKTRFDFSHPKALTIDEIIRVERLVNERIAADQPVNIRVVEKDKALKINTLRAVFGETYPDQVRVVSVGGDIDAMLANPTSPEWMKYPVEFCGGTHLKRSSEAQCFVLVSEEAVAKGIRRLVAITAQAARDAAAKGAELLTRLHTLESQAERVPTRSGARADAPPADAFADAVGALQREIQDAVIPLRVRHELREKLAELQKTAKKQEKQAASATGEAIMQRVAELLAAAETVAGLTVVVGEVPPAAPDALRGAIDWIRQKTPASAVLFACAENDKVTLIAGMSHDAVKRGLKAGDLIKEIAPLVGGRGGGRPDMAQGGGTDPAGVPTALDRAKAWIAAKLA
ncbi:MAG TPA: alanine--tRNA ligase [Phycisphaerae bacterium]|nr:alanine--tRNA ligase [Phycisphaerae bacterium]HNU46713.1 alanine--tRNA ligase [Phycisphaerae bacterium]